MPEGLEHLLYQERLRDPELLGLEKRRQRGSFQWCPVSAQGAMGTTGTHKVPNKHEEELIYCEGNRALRQAAQIDIQVWMLSCAVYHMKPALAEVLAWMISRGLFKSLKFCEEALLKICSELFCVTSTQMHSSSLDFICERQ